MTKENRYDSLLMYYGDSMNIDWRLLKAQIKAESNFNPNAKSRVGAMGLAQFMPATFAEVGVDFPHANAYNPEHSIMAQAIYMNRLMKKFNCDLDKVLASYNWGMGNVIEHGLDKMPSETKAYINNIKRYYSDFCK